MCSSDLKQAGHGDECSRHRQCRRDHRQHVGAGSRDEMRDRREGKHDGERHPERLDRRGQRRHQAGGPGTPCNHPRDQLDDERFQCDLSMVGLVRFGPSGVPLTSCSVASGPPEASCCADGWSARQQLASRSWRLADVASKRPVAQQNGDGLRARRACAWRSPVAGTEGPSAADADFLAGRETAQGQATGEHRAQIARGEGGYSPATRYAAGTRPSRRPSPPTVAARP